VSRGRVFLKQGKANAEVWRQQSTRMEQKERLLTSSWQVEETTKEF
jgi:hypothetical protein